MDNEKVIMNIYKIIVQHFSQKDSHTATETLLLAESNEQVYEWVDKKQHGYLTDVNEDSELLDIYDSDYSVIGQETHKAKMLRLCGEYHDEDYCPEDLYYGATTYGWKKLQCNDLDNQVIALESLGLLERFTQK